MKVSTRRIPVESTEEFNVHDLTSEVERLRGEVGLKEGIVTLFCPGSTGGFTTVEFEPGLVEDLEDLFERIAPRDRDYAHNQRWGDGNGHSHCRASLIGPSLTVPVEKGVLQLGTWQQIVFLDFDRPARTRSLVCQFLGLT
ncbi:MAG: secondary thiamine-phosphate synthase enzyme YjbQ [Planctomycetota bacterium]|jgi:secondary thiamine-phosphate synthase enzyme|nr:secondary thiamine-phosphate synthase enzyme YjbQ [Planctomycetota bacterium]